MDRHNSKNTIDRSLQQTVDYLPQINKSPTSYSVVLETMRIAQKIADQYDEEEIIVSYDLAMAKMAIQLQITKQPEFNNLFINLGGFHIEMAVFKAVGKFIDGCRLTDILNEAEVLARGSVNGLIDSRHFNRCKRIHPLAAAALQMLQFRKFVSEKQLDSEMLTDNLKSLIKRPIETDGNCTLTPFLENLMKDYSKYITETKAGVHGKTAQLYQQYTEFVEIFLRFSRSIRTSDFELYLDSIYEMVNLFCAFNQPNYARWILKYFCNLLNLKLKSSPLLDEFKRGASGVKITSNSLARSPVDYTLNSANKLTGIGHLTDSITARQRWAMSHGMRCRMISEFLTKLEIRCHDEIVSELSPNRIVKDRRSLEKNYRSF